MPVRTVGGALPVIILLMAYRHTRKPCLVGLLYDEYMGYSIPPRDAVPRDVRWKQKRHRN